MNENIADVVPIAPEQEPAQAPPPNPVNIRADQARVNITYGRANGDLPDPVFFDTAADRLLEMMTEALRAGSIPGIPIDRNADLTGFVVEPFTATAEIPYNRIFLRPKTEFGS